MQQQEQAAAIELASSQSAYQRAGERERDSRIYENLANMDEREASALKDREQAVLNKMKALNEIDDLEMGKIERFLKLAQMIKQIDEQDMEERSAAQMQKAELIRISAQDRANSAQIGENQAQQPASPPGSGVLQ